MPPAQGLTALHFVADMGFDGCVDSLVERDADVNAQDVSPVRATPPPRLC